MKGSNRSIVEKADIAVSNLISDGGYLNPMQANEFIRMVQEQPTLIREIRTVPMNAPTMEINKIGFTSRILHAAPTSGEALEASKRSKPTTDQITLTTKAVRAEVHIPYDVLEDNIERGSLEDTIMELISERAALDLEELLLQGDTSSSDAYLALADGMLTQSVSHVVTFSPHLSPSKTVWKRGLKAMPNKYLRNRAAMAFYCSPHAEIEYADSLASRETALGDQKVQRTYEGNYAFGVPVKSAALMPNTKALFTFPKNMIWGVQRDIMIETDRDIRAQVLIVVLSLRIDIKYEEEDAVVKLDGIDVGDTTTTTT